MRKDRMFQQVRDINVFYSMNVWLKEWPQLSMGQSPDSKKD